MSEKLEKAEELKSATELTVEFYYKRIMRILEYYVLLCFILITFAPLLHFSWIPGFVKLVYFTGFPLLLIIFVISLFKDPIQRLFVSMSNK
jgi:peptidoglycan/LPS O-acetylase OafA/YrhL